MGIYGLYAAGIIFIFAISSSVAYGFDRVAKNEKLEMLPLGKWNIFFVKKKGEREIGKISFRVQIWNFIIVFVQVFLAVIDGESFRKTGEYILFPVSMIVIFCYAITVISIGITLGITINKRYGE